MLLRYSAPEREVIPQGHDYPFFPWKFWGNSLKISVLTISEFASIIATFDIVLNPSTRRPAMKKASRHLFF